MVAPRFHRKRMFWLIISTVVGWIVFIGLILALVYWALIAMATTGGTNYV